MFSYRRKVLADKLKNENKDMAVITSPSNLYYYTGFTGGEAYFVLLADKAEGYVVTDSRYFEQVEKECPDLSLVKLESKGYSETVKEFVNNLIKSGSYSIEENKTLEVGIEESMQLSQYLKLLDVCKDWKFTVCSDFINEGRQVKDFDELIRIRKAEAIGDAAFTHILDFIKPGVSEREIALELEYFMKRQGASALSFETIVASGENSSMPHAKVTDRKLQSGDFVTMDFGCVYQGYCSDMTRTVAVGNPTDEMMKVYQIVLEANKRAMEQVAEGIACNEIDALARDYIKDHGYGEYFGHGLGHGVGLDIHEEPRFSPKCDVITKENMVITVEPGIYLPGRFGVRIEDLVVVKKDGYENLTHSEKELIVL